MEQNCYAPLSPKETNKISKGLPVREKHQNFQSKWGHTKFPRFRSIVAPCCVRLKDVIKVPKKSLLTKKLKANDFNKTVMH